MNKQTTEKGLSRMDIEQIVLGGEWADGRREYAPGLVGAVSEGGYGHQWILSVVPIPDHLNIVWMAGTMRSGLRSSDQIVRTCEAECDHAAQVFLGGCCRYAEWVQSRQNGDWQTSAMMQVRRYGRGVYGHIETTEESGWKWKLCVMVEPGGLMVKDWGFADDQSHAKRLCDEAELKVRQQTGGGEAHPVFESTFDEMTHEEACHPKPRIA